MPLFVRAPFGTYGGAMGKRTARLTEIVDVMPTLIDLAGLPPFALAGEPRSAGRAWGH